jgi:uncharacterized protein (DUF2267 family)
MANVLKHPGGFDEAKFQQREAKSDNTYRAFLKRLCTVGKMSEEFAERAAVAVVSGLEQRLTPGEARHLEAQLPVRLTKLLVSGQLMLRADGKFGSDELLEAVAREVGLPEGEVEPVVRAVFSVIRQTISEGEAEDVAAQLPSDIAALWNEAA